ncbi:mitochondrial import inner membrane translocase subunit TIM50-like [Triticum urartu]|uniref:Mitochondrial import inner membrane translocase subunit TIM50 n=4 Tax=Triticinae TaxID=1648030 RepID=A0A8R7PV09_TRIUA|nr:mitochondrial import inner membrane translocase subunit TIM50-like [Triticum urartu]XP_048564588.1 mitochondrial import inner membrane translocase subunit TIM50-like [Triticum urartu]
MSRIARSRLALTLRSSAAPFSTISPAAAAAASLASKEAPAAADASSAPKEAAAAGDPSPAPPSGTRSSFRLLKAGIFTAVTAALGATGYVTYAYSVDEVDQMTREFRKNSKLPISEDLSGFEKFKAMAYSETVKVPAAAIDLYLDVRSQIEDQIQGFVEPSSEKLLPDLPPQEQHVFTIVLDLNETLVYSDWKRERGWRTFKRPGVDAFLEHLAKFYEVVVYSDQLSMYVDPVMERLDAKGCVRHRLSRVATKYVNGKHYRDLSKLNRDPARVIYISGHALDSCLQPENCLPIKPWKLEAEDTQLIDLIPLLEFVATARVSDIRPVLASFEGRDIAAEFLERSRRVYEQKEQKQQHGRIWRR